MTIKELHMNIYSNFIHDYPKQNSSNVCHHEWINKLWYISTMQYMSASKRNDLLIHTTMWLNMLSKRIQIKNTYCIIIFIWHFRNRKFNERKQRLPWGCRGATTKGHENFWGDGNYRILIVVRVTSVYMFLKTQWTICLIWVHF